ncbi:MAG: hypothetical protein ACE5DS_05935 [Kiloniellaceae bacterium]
MKLRETWEQLPARTRVLAIIAAAAIALAFAYNAAIAPLRKEIRTGLDRIAEIDGRLGRPAAPGPEPGELHPFAHKRLEPLSGAAVVDVLTETAHANAIRRIRFKTEALQPVPGGGGGAAAGSLQRMPVRVDLETEGSTFAAYLDSLKTLRFPLSVERFEMRPNPKPGSAFLIRLDLEVYGTGA